MKKEHGISLVELVLVIAAVGFLILLIANLPSSLASISRSQHQSLATEIANRQIETLRKQGYANLANGTTSIVDSSLSQIPFATGSYQISDCSISLCPNLEQTKVLDVTIFWNEAGQSKKVRLTTLTSNGGIGQ